MTTDYLHKILAARVYDVAEETPIDAAPLLSSRLSHQVLLKREDLQPVFSFKIRGAYNKMAQLSTAQLAKGVITASAGNHAQGVALAAKYIGCKAIIVMPCTTPQIKIDAVRRRGAKVILHGDSYDEAATHARQLAKQKHYTYVHPYDDADVIAGQGTIGVEILRQHTGALDAIFIPVGGGGLCAGIATYVKYLRPDIKIIAVEPDDAACLKAALAAGKPVTLPQVGLFADGVAVATIGKEPFRLLKDLIDDVIAVSSDEICAAIKDIFEDTRVIAEPAGAVAIAGLKKYVQNTDKKHQHLMAIISGANSNFDRLRYISERTELGEGREALLNVTIPEVAGSFRRFCQLLGKRAITEFNYRFSDSQQAQIFVGVKLGSEINAREQLINELNQKGYTVLDLSDDEMAKLHIRHMVGGHAPACIKNEVLYRFEFPERPGALTQFLISLGERWNISLFHYRNHASAYGRVLAGFEVPKNERRDVRQFLTQLNFPFVEETDNPAYQLFLNAAPQNQSR
jgi:threonine dehydratase